MHSFTTLPVEILQYIISFVSITDLPNVFRLSKFFNTLELKQTTFLSLDFNNTQNAEKTRRIDYEDLHRLLNKMPDLHTLDLSFHVVSPGSLLSLILWGEYENSKIKTLLLNDCKNFKYPKTIGDLIQSTIYT